MTVKDADGKETGDTWTMVYDEGFKFFHNNREYFAFHQYKPKDNTDLQSDEVADYISYCGAIRIGWYVSDDQSEWGCYRGVKIEDLDGTPITDPLTRVLDTSGHTAGSDSASEEETTDSDTAKKKKKKKQKAVVSPTLSAAEKSGDDSSFLMQRGPVSPMPLTNTVTALPAINEDDIFTPDYAFIELHNNDEEATWHAGVHEPFNGAKMTHMRKLVGGERFRKVPDARLTSFLQTNMDSLLEVSASASASATTTATTTASNSNRDFDRNGNMGDDKDKSRSPRSPVDTRPDAEKYASIPEHRHEHLDWRDVDGKNYDIEVKNQGSCGSCYAVAAATMLSSRFKINNVDVDLSAQDALSCADTNQGCEGGYPILVAKYSKDFGLLAEQDAPYRAKSDACDKVDSSFIQAASASSTVVRTHGNRRAQSLLSTLSTASQAQTQDARRLLTNTPTSTRYHAKGARYVGGYYGGCGEVSMMEELQDGPIVVAFDAPNSLFHYKHGIYTGSDPPSESSGDDNKIKNPWEKTNHAVICVGYGVDNEKIDSETNAGMKYWIIKNTWGKDWGEDGYFRIRRGSDECGIESMAVAADPVIVSANNKSSHHHRSHHHRGR